MIESLSHITLVVRDLERTATLFKDVLDAKEIYESGSATHFHSKERFFLIGNQWIAIMEGEPLSEQTYNHVAFKIPDADFDQYKNECATLV